MDSFLNPLEVLLGFQIPANFPDTLFFGVNFQFIPVVIREKYFYDIKKLKFIKNVFRQRKYKLLYLGRMHVLFGSKITVYDASQANGYCHSGLLCPHSVFCLSQPLRGPGIRERGIETFILSSPSPVVSCMSTHRDRVLCTLRISVS